MPARASARGLRLAAAAALAVVAGVHFQQYVDFMSEVPTVGVLFLLNAAGGAGLVLALVSPDARLRALAGLGGLGLALGSLVSIAIALASSFFGYSEPTLRFPIVLAVAAEVVLIPLLAGLLRGDARAAAPGPGAVGSRPGFLR